MFFSLENEKTRHTAHKAMSVEGAFLRPSGLRASESRFLPTHRAE
jgi:hypothetical protein